MKLLMPVEVAINQITEVRDGEFSIGGATIKWTGDTPVVGDYFVTGNGVYEVWTKQCFDANKGSMITSFGPGQTLDDEDWKAPYLALRAIDRETAIDYLDGDLPLEYTLIKDTGWEDEGKQDIRAIYFRHDNTNSNFMLSYTREGDAWSGYRTTFDGVGMVEVVPKVTYEFEEYSGWDVRIQSLVNPGPKVFPCKPE